MIALILRRRPRVEWGISQVIVVASGEGSRPGFEIVNGLLPCCGAG